MATIPKRYLYKVFSSTGAYLGLLPNVTSDFSYSYELNTAGTQITITCGVSADTSAQPVSGYTDESGNPYTDESGANAYTTEGVAPIVAPGSSGTTALIKNGNRIQIYEFSSWNPNGVCVFLGQMEHWEASFGGQNNDKITILCYSDGVDLSNHLVRSPQIVDQSQSSATSSITYSSSTSPPPGQSISPGSGVSEITYVTLQLAASGGGSVTVKLLLYASPTGIVSTSRYLSGATPDATVTLTVSGASPQNYTFKVNYQLPTPAPNYYVIALQVTSAGSVVLYGTTTSSYAGGNAMNASPLNGLYFTTDTISDYTNATFTTTDPSTMLMQIIDAYQSESGIIGYTTGSVVSSGLSFTYQFNTNTVFEALGALLSLAPNGYYWYADLGTDTLYFKPTNTVADIVLTKGRHLDQITLIATIENIKNTVYFSGGVVSGNNLYLLKSDATSVSQYGPRLDRLSDNRVTLTATATQIALNDVLVNKNEQYQTTVTVVDGTMDLTTLKVGMVVGFNGFGTFVDNLLTQIVRIDYTPEEATLTLGVMPKRLHKAFEQAVHGLIALQTIANPGTPS